jgi:multiple sugar transport system substrate-binding protein
MYYNADLFDRYGAAYPEAGWTWDEFLEAAIQVRDPDEGIYGFVTFPFFTIPFIYQHGGRLVDDWRTPTRTTFDDPLTVEAVDWYAGLVHDYDVVPSPQEADELFGNDGNAAYIFWRRRAGMYLGLLSDRGGEAWGPGGDWDMQWGMVPLPVDAQAATLGFGHAYAIAADTEYPDACWQWLRFLSEQMPAYAMPARRSLAESEAYENRVGLQVALVALESVENALLVTNAQAELEPDMEQYIERYMEALQEIMNGNTTAREALPQIQMQAEGR